jgi:O-phosphoseryl-tRNA(Cys) synthetase
MPSRPAAGPKLLQIRASERLHSLVNDLARQMQRSKGTRLSVADVLREALKGFIERDDIPADLAREIAIELDKPSPAASRMFDELRRLRSEQARKVAAAAGEA